MSYRISLRLFCCLFMINLSVSCNYARSIKSKIKEKFSGQQTEQSSTQDKEIIKINNEGSKKIVEITPRGKLQNLMRAFILNPDSSYKKILLSEFSLNNPILLNEKRDEEIISFINKLIPLFQEQNKESIDVAVFLTQSLRGANRDEARKVLGLLVDYSPIDFLTVSSSKFPGENCMIIQSIPQDVTEDGKKLFLENRAKNLESLKSSVQNDVSLYNALVDCQTSLRNYMSYLFYGKSSPRTQEQTEVQSEL